jgi:predicted dehydrogenase
MNTSLVIGMGIGQLYKTVLEKLGYTVITVDQDPAKGAMYTSVDQAIIVHKTFNTAHICTPNFTHFDIASKVAPCSKIVFVEKPGVSNSFAWQRLIEEFKYTRFMMVKNNMWRNNIGELKELANRAKIVNIKWIRKNCIPSPGSWFTTKKLAFGGVSRDLMPHLLSLYIALNPDWRKESINDKNSLRYWDLKDIDSTDYGTINPNGTYDVDDACHIDFGKKWGCQANWRSMDIEDSSIEFIMQDRSIERFELGWCPEEAYESMIKKAIDSINDANFWLEQYDQDIWIHEQIEKL